MLGVERPALPGLPGIFLVCAQEVPGHLATRSAQLRTSWWLETQGRQSSEDLGIVMPTVITQDLITTDQYFICVSPFILEAMQSSVVVALL